MKTKAIFCWSGGKDSALALYHILKDDKVEVVALLTTLNRNFKRVSMHGVREELLDLQADSIGIPLIKMYVEEGTNAEYEQTMETVLLDTKKKGVTDVIFGDIFLEDLRKYREANLEKIGLRACFPLWKKDTAALVREFITLGFKTITCCVNDAYLGSEYVGKEINSELLDSLPASVDPCGENGEYHTFCFEGPIFKNKINIKVAEKTYRPLEIKTSDQAIKTKGFWFCELLPAEL
jgi:uncharacterized protein (TIGR00290 family)